jgi:hypothetical protein
MYDAQDIIVDGWVPKVNCAYTVINLMVVNGTVAMRAAGVVASGSLMTGDVPPCEQEAGR